MLEFQNMGHGDIDWTPIIIRDEDIPYRLKEIPHPPKALAYVGKLPSENLVYLTVIGSRRHTSYGKEVTRKLIESLRGLPVVIVSGLALGVDAIAHELAISVGLPTIAFPGSGLDQKVLYPRSHLNLAKRIVENGGAIISEFKHDQSATMWTFPQRNRLMAGISDAVLIIEAEEKSGSLITTKLATDYNRTVLSVPGSIFSECSSGTNMLLRLGATPITNEKDLREALGFAPQNNANIEMLEDCSPEEKNVLQILREPLTRDELIRAIDLPITKANTLISSMEIKGLIKEEYGQMRRG